ncbi:MAG: TIGR01459 family HAD-type hydrolase [Hyphomonadaceae bacterium]|nr:TIGR01459 family HAD-type hydrolase [Hyphomonadaceae bacterium]
MRVVSSLDWIASAYDAVFCDVWGVVHNGRAAFAPALAALQRFRARGGHVLLLTNVPKPNDPIPGQLDRLGVPRDAWDAIVTSGDAIRLELAKRAPGPMHKIGPPHDAALWAGLGLAFADLETAAFIGISGLNHDERETPEDYRDLLARAKARDLALICANPDIVVRVGDRLVWCAGAIARDYAALGGRVVMAGKPHAPIYDLAFAKLADGLGRAIERARVLCIGDGVGTDVKGANAQGLDVVFIASGMHGEALMTDGALDPDKARAALAAEHATATFVMDALR